MARKDIRLTGEHMNTGRCGTELPWIIVLFSIASCTLTLPEPITVPTVDLAFKFSGSDDQTVRRLQATVYQDAQTCAGRLNRHRKSAGSFNTIRTIVTALGGLTSGAGGIVSATVSSDDQQESAAYVAAIGGAIALAGTFIVSIVGDPSDRLSRHSDALRSWDQALALSLDLSSADPMFLQGQLRKVDLALRDCIKDKAPVDTRSRPGAPVPEQ